MRSQAVWTGRSGRLTYPQAIPLADYRRKLFFDTQLPKLMLLLGALALYTSAASPWVQPHWGMGFGATARPALSNRPATETTAAAAEAVMAADAAADLESTDAPPVASWRYLAQGQATAAGFGSVEMTNALIAISFIDGYVIQPGAQFSFDDVARTWDYREDTRYLWSYGTSRYGLIPMRGGGVCWVSTALWRAALWSGLPTDVRQNHEGLVRILGAGTDATNTLVIRNDSPAPITIRAWVDDEDVNVALLTDSDAIKRTARVYGPDRLGPGSYVLHQDVSWPDGTTTTQHFYSGYFW
jgi:hypothetical protein